MPPKTVKKLQEIGDFLRKDSMSGKEATSSGHTSATTYHLQVHFTRLSSRFVNELCPKLFEGMRV